MSTVHPGNRTLPLRVVAARWEAESVTSFEFASPDGADLPPWEPGAHVDVHLPSGTVRQYSLYGDPADRTRYRIAVLELPQGRGGSVKAHRELRPGRVVHIGLPRTNFALAEAERYVFVAGGIGITPILPMVREVAARGATVREAGVEHPSSCEMGFCGTCETAVLSGEVDHRDDLFTEEERLTCASMLICVSRAKGRDRLVLDI